MNQNLSRANGDIGASSPSLAPVLDLSYLAASVTASPWLLYRLASDARYRTGLRERFGFHAPRASDRPALWIHGVSVGEILTGVPLVESFQARHADWDVMLSTVTVTGQAVARRRFGGRRVVYFPVDWSAAVRRSLRRLRPSAIVMLELELWPNFYLAAAREGIPLLIMNGRMTERSLRRYRWVHPLARRVLSTVSAVCAQSAAHAERYRMLGVPPERVRVTGNMKFDGAPAAVAAPFDEPVVRRLGIRPGDRVLVGGSTHAPEEEMLLRAYGALRARFPDLRLVLVPRHPDRADAVAKVVAGAGFRCYKTSLLSGLEQPPPDLRQAVGVVDAVGDLRRLYGVATLAFVGGSLVPHGGQNMLEPAALACPAVFGAYVENFQEIADALLAAGAAAQVPDRTGLLATLENLLSHPERLAAMGSAGRRAVEQGRGATDRNLRILEDAIF